MSKGCGTTLLALALLLLPCAALCQPTPVDEFLGTLNGGAAYPPNDSAGTGPVELIHDPAGHTLLIDLSFSALSGSVTSAHIHCCAPPPTSVGVAVFFNGFPVGVTSGSFQQLLDLTFSGNYSSAFLNGHGGTAGGAEAALRDALRVGNAYVDIHTSMYPGGEVRAHLGWIVFRNGFESGDMDPWSSHAP